MSNKNKLEDLFINEEEELEKYIPLVKKVIRIREETGEPYILPPKEKLTQRRVIALYLIGKYFSFKLKKSDSPSASNVEISNKLSLEKRIVNARLNDLKKDRLVERVNKGEWKYNTINLKKFLEDLLEDLGE